MAAVAVGHEGDVAPGQALRVVVQGIPIAIFNVNDEYFAIGDTCTHEEFSLSEGELVDEYTIECPLHGAQYDIRTGAVLCLPATNPTDSYSIWVEDGVLMVEVPE